MVACAGGWAAAILMAGLANLLQIKCALAITASPHPFNEKQPDGTSITLQIKGDEFYHYNTDLDGYTVVKSPQTNQFVYANYDAVTDTLHPTTLVVGKADPSAAGIAPDVQLVDKGKQNPVFYYTADEKQGDGSGFKDQLFRRRRRVEDTSGARHRMRRIAPRGIIRNLVLCIRWADHASRTLPTTAQLGVLMNKQGGDPDLAPTGSVRDVYLKNSYGSVNITSVITSWITVSQTQAWVANGESGLNTRLHNMIREALGKLDSNLAGLTGNQITSFGYFDQDSNGQIDMFTILHSGYGAEFGGTAADGTNSDNRIWSHKWAFTRWTSSTGARVSIDDYHISPAVWGTSGSKIGRIGVVAHESGHFFGLPDLYDGSQGSGLGCYSLMANSWGCDGSQYYPPLMDAWCKAQLGFVTPRDITASPSTYAAPQSATSATVFRINLGPSGEYLLVENRQKVSYDNPLPAGGLAIFHIDDSVGGNTNPGYPGGSGWPSRHYQVASVQADGRFDLEKGGRSDSSDFYRSGGVTQLTPSTTPSTQSYRAGTFGNANNVYITSISASAATMTFVYSKGPPAGTNNACTRIPCKNNGVCIPNGTSAYTCQCVGGWSGPTCESFNYCASEPCQNGATCRSSGTGYSCTCVDRWTGINCEYQSCGQDCTVYSSRLAAQEAANYTVDTPATAYRAISATLAGPSGSDFDLYLYSWRGSSWARVAKSDGSSSQEQISAYALTSADTRMTVQVKSYSGAGSFSLRVQRTRSATCSGVTCSGHGTCSVVNNVPTCRCSAGYTGSNCSVAIATCAGVTCSNHGTCSIVNNAAKCTCNSGYTGNDCSTPVESTCTISCSEHGVCNPDVNGGTCDCDEGYTGDQCQWLAGDCFDDPCENNGTCVAFDDGSMECDCPAGFFGDRCETVGGVCSQAGQCQNGGLCKDIGSSYICECPDGWQGERCEKAIPACTSSVGCTKVTRYLGQNRVDRYTPFISSPGTLSALMIGPMSSDFDLYVELQNSRGYWYTALALDDSSSRASFTGVTISRSMVGKVRLAVYAARSSGQYSLRVTFRPDPCFCSGHGQCRSNTQTCQCNARWVGVQCETFSVCSGNPCGANGQCVATGSAAYKCQCSSGWTGAKCDRAKCGVNCTRYGAPISSNALMASTGYPTIATYEMSFNRNLSLVATLTGPAGTDFDLYLQVKRGNTYVTLTSSEGQSSNERIIYNAVWVSGAPMDTFRWLVTAYSGSGQFRLDVTTSSTLSKVNPCTVTRCNNGGQCRNTGGVARCTCSPGFSGLRCKVSTRNRNPAAANSSSTSTGFHLF